MKTGILGGSFNPIHNGHLHMAYEALEKLNLDRILFLPNYIPPHKAAPGRDTNHVVEMIKLAIEGEEKFSLSTRELEMKGLSYTYETLQYFTKNFPEDEFYLIIGEDSYVNFSAWKNPRIIISLVQIVVLDRQVENEHLREETARLFRGLSKSPIFIPGLRLDISSSDIRSRVQEGRHFGYLVPAKVKEYITDHELYKEQN